MNKALSMLLLLSACVAVQAQDRTFSQMDESGNITSRGGGARNPKDSLGSDKKIPKGMYVWTVDKMFGDIRRAEPDTVSHMYMNSIFTTGLRGEYNTTGNLGAPRIARIFIDRQEADQFIFTQPYDFVLTPVEKYHFTNTLSPFTNLSYNTAGNRTNGEDHFTAKYAVNAGKKLGAGFKFDYIYGRGYYQNQSTSHFNYSMHASYLGDRYQAHVLFSTLHQKVTENGGITNDDYVKHPELFNENFSTSEIPVNLDRNWNRNDNQHLFFTHRYSVGFTRKVPMTKEEIEARKFAISSQKEAEERKAQQKAREKKNGDEDTDDDDEPAVQDNFAGRPDNAKVVKAVQPADSLLTADSTLLAAGQPTGELDRIAVNGKAAADSILAASSAAKEDTSWLKDEYVPVTSFIHTAELNNYKRIYQAYETPDDFYANTYDVDEKFSGDSIYDKTNLLSLRNTFAISLLEGFNKWAKAGLKVFAAHELRHFTLPDVAGTAKYNENNISVGGQLIKTQGKTLHYNALGEIVLAGEDAGNVKIDAAADLNFPLFGDTVTLAASGFFHRTNPTFYFRHYHSKHLWWDYDDLDAIVHTRIQGLFGYKKTRTTLRVAVDEIKNLTYFGQGYTIHDDFSRTGTYVSVNQESDAVTLVTASLCQDLTLGPLNWENVITWQKSTKESVLPVPSLNIYTNLYLRFKIAKVLKCDLGADMRFFTKYYAPDYSPLMGQYAVQTGEQRTEVGNYPVVNAYINFHLKHTRFFVMMSHINAGNGKADYFFTPHYPLNERIFRFGVSWNFFN